MTTVRLATAADRDAALAMVPRLHAFGPSGLRPVSQMNDAERRALAAAIETPAATHVVYVAEGAAGDLAGICYVREATDYFTGEQHAHLDILMVSDTAEGQGVARALMEAGESWARAQGHRFMTLMVFAENARAIAFYERGGFRPDMIRYAKEL